ncbi:extensin family protein [Cognatishimia sp. MH4019]|uniref:extensin-like domain-containing protein n=1 Tax=Cognatishimia sp. MH4019 TaxID=2854030 RepID=UPI001CD4FE6A|nr:extensin family protein [Cognatishimia sp. MH4019]
MVPLRVTDPVTPATQWKLTHAINDPALCRSVLSKAAAFEPQPDKEVSDQCHIRNRVLLSSVGQARIGTLETRCPIALRLAMWEHHGLQPAARDLLGTDIARIVHIGSYNCRPIRSPSGGTGRMSTHATADAVDIAGVILSDGSRVSLISDWQGSDNAATFLREAQRTSCIWFKTSLGPEFNRLHADHFHLQNTGWGTCR